MALAYLTQIVVAIVIVDVEPIIAVGLSFSFSCLAAVETDLVTCLMATIVDVVVDATQIMAATGYGLLSYYFLVIIMVAASHKKESKTQSSQLRALFHKSLLCFFLACFVCILHIIFKE